MKTILVDAISTFILKEGGVFKEMYDLLELYPNEKIILTSANDEQIALHKLNEMPYKYFTLKHNPEKTDPIYYKKMLENFGFKAEDVVYFEHNMDAVESAKKAGIKTMFYDENKKDLGELKTFFDGNL